MNPSIKVFNGMQSVSSLLQEKDVEHFINRIASDFEKFEKTGQRSEKQSKVFWWEQICRNLFASEWESQRNRSVIFRKVMGQTSQFTLTEIRHIFESSMRWSKNPPALFWKLVKAKRAMIKDQLNEG